MQDGFRNGVRVLVLVVLIFALMAVYQHPVWRWGRYHGTQETDIERLWEDMEGGEDSILLGTIEPVIPYHEAAPMFYEEPLEEPLEGAGPGMSWYVVKDGDSLRRIARRELGDESRYGEILKLNPEIKDPNLIPEGLRLRMPAAPVRSSPEATDRAGYGEPAPEEVAQPPPAVPEKKVEPPARPPARSANPPVAETKRPGAGDSPRKARKVHVFKRGETIIGIARRLYGDESRFKDILEANKGRIGDPSSIPVGFEVVIP